jgi:hypothetical protein
VRRSPRRDKSPSFSFLLIFKPAEYGYLYRKLQISGISRCRKTCYLVVYCGLCGINPKQESKFLIRSVRPTSTRCIYFHEHISII